MHNAMRLEELATTIDSRETPLGADFSTGCWGAIAADMAALHGEDPCSYFGFTEDEYQAEIRLNRALPEIRRNYVMSQLTRALAASARAGA
jgi:hypothetical protein